MNNTYIEELSLNHWPSLSTLLYGGWLLRFANGFTKRANSIHPLYHSTGETLHKITECEKLYAANGLPAVFKITPFIHPAELDSTLDQEPEEDSYPYMTMNKWLPADLALWRENTSAV
ncbi:N-acetyltransferase GCN5 [Paenibacillus sp. TCA20]|uniref:GNAT family N-acetyltransferase, cg3035/Rv0428c family n=1 Tax=Paenibacillus sp. TCA20 TaxID=1499968 RepID=UPI0004D62302|nr:N-acetyltransferase GCN5 [Paenibacillus sp. TCA20]